MEVAQHIGGDVVRCIMLAASEGLCKDMEVVATGKGIAVPVGEKTLGRLFNVLGDTLDGGESLEGEENGSSTEIHPACRPEPGCGDAGNRHKGRRPARPLCKGR